MDDDSHSSDAIGNKQAYSPIDILDSEIGGMGVVTKYIYIYYII